MIKRVYIHISVILVTCFVIVLLTNCSSNNTEQSEGKINSPNNNVSNDAKSDKDVEEPTKNANSKVLDLNEKDFDNTIKKGVVLVDFWAPWCAPCRMQGPVIDELAKEMGNGVKITKLNVDYNNAISLEYDVKNIPTIIIFKDGKPALRFVGVQTKEFLKKQIEELL